jgi:hypothetical protein
MRLDSGAESDATEASDAGTSLAEEPSWLRHRVPSLIAGSARRAVISHWLIRTRRWTAGSIRAESAARSQSGNALRLRPFPDALEVHDAYA